MPRLDGLDPAVRAALVAVAGHGLPATAHRPPPPAPLDDKRWVSLVRAVRMERLLGLLDRAIADGALPATDGQAADAEEAAAQSLRGIVSLESRLVDVARRLHGDDVDFVVLKGPAVARLDEADPGLRHYADIDILVRSEDVASAIVSLGAFGYKRDLPERRPGFDRSFGKEVPLADGQRSELDLHRTLALGSFGLRLDVAALWECTVPLRVGPAELAALDAAGRFFHACVTAVLGDEHPRLVALRDLARLSASPDLDAGRLARIAPPGGGAAVVATAVATCRATLGDVIGREAASFAAGATPSRWEQVCLRAYRAQGGSNTLELLSGALGVRGGDRLRYLRAVVTPDAGYLAARRRAGRPREWTTGLREVVSGARHRAGRGAGRA